MVTRPALVGCLYCRWLPLVATKYQPSASISLTASRTFITSFPHGQSRPACLGTLWRSRAAEYMSQLFVLLGRDFSSGQAALENVQSLVVRRRPDRGD